MRAALDDCTAADNQGVDVYSTPGKDDSVDRTISGRSGQSNAVQPDADQIRQGAYRDASSFRPSKARIAVAGCGPEKLMGRMRSTHEGRKPLVELDGSCLLEEINHCMGIASQCQMAIDATDSVGQVALCSRAQASEASAFGQELDIRGTEMRGVHCRESGRQGAGAIEQLQRSGPISPYAFLVLGRLF
jgi:hypothetical protein